MTKSIDWDLSVQLANGSEETAAELLSMMRAQLPEFQLLLSESFAANDANSLASHAHKLHGGCCYCGLPKLKQLIRSLEIHAKNNPESLDQALFNETMSEINQVIESLDREDYT